MVENLTKHTTQIYNLIVKIKNMLKYKLYKMSSFLVSDRSIYLIDEIDELIIIDI